MPFLYNIPEARKQTIGFKGDIFLRYMGRNMQSHYRCTTNSKTARPKGGKHGRHAGCGRENQGSPMIQVIQSLKIPWKIKERPRE